MSRKIGVNRVKLQSYVIIPSSSSSSIVSGSTGKISLLSDQKRVQVSQQNGKEGFYDFDQGFELNDPQGEKETQPSSIPSTLSPRHIPVELVNTLSNSIELVLLGYCSTILCYCSQSPLRIPSSSSSASLSSLPQFLQENDPLDELIQQIGKSLYNKIQTPPSSTSSSSSSSASSSISSEFHLELSCFELVDNQFRDLLGGNTGMGDVIRIKDYQSDEALCVDGIQSQPCHSFSQFLEIIRNALKKRLLMILGGSQEANLSNTTPIS